MKAVADLSAGLSARINSLFEQIFPKTWRARIGRRLSGKCGVNMKTSEQQRLEITKPPRNEKKTKQKSSQHELQMYFVQIVFICSITTATFRFPS